MTSERDERMKSLLKESYNTNNISVSGTEAHL